MCLAVVNKPLDRLAKPVHAAWPYGARRATARRRVGILSVLLATTLGACARPQGPLFSPLDQERIWPAPPETPRVKLLGAIGSSADLHAAQPALEALRSALRGRRPPIHLVSPHGIAAGPRNLLAVTDTGGAAVHVIDLQDRSHLRVTGWDDQRFEVPLGAAWLGDRLFVTDAGRREVIEMDSHGRVHRTFGADVLVRPVGVAYIGSPDRLYVVDGGAHCLRVFTPDGQLLKTIGQRGAAPGQFNYPSHVACRGEVLVVADSGNFRVQLLDLDGRCLRTIGRKGNGAGDFSLPKGVALDSEGHLYVVDSHFENVQVFDDQGRLLLSFGEEGSNLGELSLPAGMAIDLLDRIWVANAGNRRVEVFEYLRTAL